MGLHWDGNYVRRTLVVARIAVFTWSDLGMGLIRRNRAFALLGGVLRGLQGDA